MLVDEISVLDKLSVLKSFLIGEMRICNTDSFKKTEKSTYFKNVSESVLQNLVDILQKNRGDQEIIEYLKKKNMGSTNLAESTISEQNS